MQDGDCAAGYLCPDDFKMSELAYAYSIPFPNLIH